MCLPSPIKPNHSVVNLQFTDSVYPSIDYTFRFDVLYTASIIAQRWNDVLRLNNNSSDDKITIMSCGMTPRKYTESELYVSLVFFNRMDFGIIVFVLFLSIHSN